MLLRKAFFIFLLGIFSVHSFANFLPNPSYRTYNVDDGLSNSIVHAIGQDSYGYMWFGTEDGLNRFDGHNFRVYKFNQNDSDSISGNSISQIYLADDNSLWIATNHGLNLYHPNTDSFTRYNTQSGLSDNAINSVLKVEDSLWIGTSNGLNLLNLKTNETFVFPVKNNGQGTNHKWVSSLSRQGDYIWISTTGGGLNRYDLKQKKFEYFVHASNDNSSISSNATNHVYVTSSNQLWVSLLRAGVNRYKPSCNCFERFTPNAKYNDATAASFSESSDGLWIANKNGLSKYNYTTENFDNYSLLEPHELGNGTRDVRSVFVSNDGTIWFGSFQMGVSSISKGGFGFQTYQYSEAAENSLLADDINSLYIQDGYLWTGSVNGLYRYPMLEGGKLGKASLILKTFALKIEPSIDGGYWIAGNTGLYKLNKELEQVFHVTHENLVYDHSDDGAVLDVIETQSGDVFAINWQGGLTKLIDFERKKFKQVGLNGNARGISANSSAYALAEVNNQLWIGTTDGVNSASDQVHHYALTLSPDQPNVIVYYILAENNNLLLGTSNGVYEYHQASDKFNHIDLDLRSNFVQAISKESPSVYWLSTFNGLYRWHKENNTVTSYFKSDGLQGNEFNTKGVITGLDERIYFSGIDGITSINLKKFNDSNTPSSVEKLKWIDEITGSPINGDLNIEIDENNNPIKLKYFVADYFKPENHEYRYQLGDSGWISNGSNNSILLSGLSAGDYNVYLQYKRKGIDWQDAQGKVYLKVRPPLYKSNPAIILYAVIVVLCAYLVYHYRTNLIIQRQKELQSKVDEQTAELASMLGQKNHLFANISHELRTPITLINAPLEQLAEQHNLTKQQQKLINLAKSNGNRLFNLVERILQLSKVENKEKQKELINIDTYLMKYVSAFSPLMQQKNIKFTTNLNSNAVISADKEDLTSIIENLLSNAFKYTQSGGWVEIQSHVSDEQFKLSLSNQHQGYDPEQINKIFDRFERLGQSDSEQGYGLGLALVKEICQQNGWNINVTSEGGIVAFTLTITDFTLTSAVSQPSGVLTEKEQKAPSKHKNKQSVLIVEDNDELRQFIEDLLADTYQIYTATNGKVGLDKAIEHIPDLIISDVMMPEMDGFELVKALSEHDNTSHIPTILLTAKADEQSQLKGLELGAIDYIAKPFETKKLILKINNTLERQRLRFKSQDIKEEAIPAPITSERDQKFIQRLNDTVEKNYQDNEFTVEKLVNTAAMSERQLQRKLKALFNQTPAEYIRNYRLLKAKELLLQGKSISLTSDLVGFNSSSYFSRSFKIAFNQSPKEFITQHTK